MTQRYRSLFLMKLQALRPATLLKSDSSKDVFTWILRSFKKHLFENSCFWISSVLGAYCPFWIPFKKQYKIEDSPWMFRRVIWTCEQPYYKINYKYERCKHTKTKSCYKNISCWFICSFIFFIFSSLWWFKIWFVFHRSNLMN